ncbi:hypothetical protein [Chelativorans sp. AA-79]|uniref:hypothetical protein n=1 Tax=Chelativorans sp. AA-79 TaxID=3028735 RepID=UPI0023F7E743|nr:hypothetical protein [Chelativorans sp. AA-79]WEX10342.1 hypothetical protein PVE73_05110 [Chelativorans sp. AA-79]
MTLSTIRRWLRPWLLWRERRASTTILAKAIPAFAEAMEREREALRRSHTQGIAKARQAKREAVHRALRASMPKARVRVKAIGSRVKI